MTFDKKKPDFFVRHRDGATDIMQKLKHRIDQQHRSHDERMQLCKERSGSPTRERSLVEGENVIYPPGYKPQFRPSVDAPHMYRADEIANEEERKRTVSFSDEPCKDLLKPHKRLGSPPAKRKDMNLPKKAAFPFLNFFGDIADMEDEETKAMAKARYMHYIDDIRRNGIKTASDNLAIRKKEGKKSPRDKRGADKYSYPDGVYSEGS